MTDSNSATSKSAITAVFSKSSKFDKLPEKYFLYIVRAFLPIGVSKIFVQVSDPDVKFDEKHG